MLEILAAVCAGSQTETAPGLAGAHFLLGEEAFECGEAGLEAGGLLGKLLGELGGEDFPQGLDGGEHVGRKAGQRPALPAPRPRALRRGRAALARSPASAAPSPASRSAASSRSRVFLVTFLSSALQANSVRLDTLSTPAKS